MRLSSRSVEKRDELDELIARYGEVENATLVDTPPPGDYVYELKYDGYRILAFKRGRKVRLMSRRRQDWTSQFPTIVDAVAGLAARELVLDGEVVAPDERGTPSFQRLQNRQGPLAYVVFDVLQFEGGDQRSKALAARRRLLEKILAKCKPPLALSAAIDGNAAQLLQASCGAGFEGLIGKRAGSAYVPGRTLDWIKVKCEQRQEFAIIGYLPYTGSQRGVVGSLLLAVRRDDSFVFCGKVGTGFDFDTRRRLGKLLEARHATKSPVSGVPRFGGMVRFNELGPVCEVRFTEWTESGSLRHPSYLGLRPDKRPEDCVREQAPAEARRAVSARPRREPGLATRKR